MSNFDHILVNREERKLWTGAERLVPGNEVATYSRMLQLNDAQRSGLEVSSFGCLLPIALEMLCTFRKVEILYGKQNYYRLPHLSNLLTTRRS